MNIKYVNVLRDLMFFKKYNFKNSKAVRRNILNGQSFVLAYCLISVVYCYFRFPIEQSVYFLVLLPILAILWFFFFPYFYINSINSQNKRNRKKPDYKEEIELKVSEDLIIVIKEGVPKEFPVNSIKKVVFLKNYALIYINETDDLIIPLYSLNPDVKDALEKFITENYGDKIAKK
ncbi:MAG TPA: hypothetical protein PK385_04030 [Spirochaetota bacterium]|nr:hypothetical protein [Spirochaetota bacterium]HOS33282.1 hypothetical protein [Spirochaetota bacterium]HOS55207.1 hypothetical protein [Spirochaetota bacterium]HPK61439.1 hypothetical protein [Spirochaetota bacterium]HQF78560.1 hypothetical protein [Spirochaetota bacterium]